MKLTVLADNTTRTDAYYLANPELFAEPVDLLLEMNSQVIKTVDYLQKQQPRQLCPCHCTCFHSRAAIQNAVPVKEVYVGDNIEII